MVDFPGQVAPPSKEEGQRNPGDYEALVAQGPVAIHDNETLGVTDMGVIMCRKQIRQGIRAVAKGEPLAWPTRDNNAPTSTYNLELVSRVPPLPGIDDAETVRRFGNRVAELVIESGGLPPGKRHETAKQMVAELIAREFS
jgi:hypothetical protein